MGRHAGLNSPTVAKRSGISLLEVLVSMFVMTVGLLGLAALIPIGRFEVEQAAKMDRGATLGNQAYRDMQLRGLLNAQNEWLMYDPAGKQFNSAIYVPSPGAPPQFRPNLLPPFAIDPLMFADPRNYDAVWGSGAGNSQMPKVDAFPYMNVDSGGANDWANAGLDTTNTPRVARLTLNQLMPMNSGSLIYSNWNDPNQQTAFAITERIFRGHDDLAYFTPDDADGRPIQQFNISTTHSTNNSATTSDDFNKQSVTARLSSAIGGEYSWLITVSPTLGEVFNYYKWGSGQYQPDAMRSYVVSVVVFHRRPITPRPRDDNDPPAERTVAITFAGTGVGGGSAHLSTSASNSLYLRDIRPNQWIMVTGRMNVTQPPWYSGPPVPAPVVAKWYRIVTVDDGGEIANGHRDVTLDGPDWDTVNGKFMTLGSTPEGNIHGAAAIFDGVVAVYDKTMQLDLTGN